MANYRADIPPVPPRLQSRPVERGYPVPWFVAEVEPGRYDFRVIDASKFEPAIKKKLCWVCGQKLGAYLAFTIGPMCAINRTISEPPSHRECAEWSIKACPFLTQRQEERRDSHLPEGVTEPGGIAITRQPGVVVLWVTRSYQEFRVANGLLFTLGEPLEVHWFREGRKATRAECLESIESGYPQLMELALLDGAEGVRHLEAKRQQALELLPAETL